MSAILLVLFFSGCVTVDSNSNPNNSSGGQLQAVAQSTKCTDSDGGKNYFEKGYVTGTCVDCSPPGIVSGNTDSCANVDAAGKVTMVETSQKLVEFYCTSNGWLREIYNCPKGCAAGACIQ